MGLEMEIILIRAPSSHSRACKCADNKNDATQLVRIQPGQAAAQKT